MSRRAVIAAGGTGGHIFPAQALAEALRAEGWAISLLTDARGMRHAGEIPADERAIVSAASPRLSKPWTLPMAALKIMRGVAQAKRLIRAGGAGLVIGFGGYPAFPAMRAARALGVPILIHEQNAVLGRVNRVMAPHASAIASGFDRLSRLPESARARWSVTGNPLRTPIVEASRTAYAPPEDTVRLLVLGGSLGARILSETVPAAVSALPETLRARLEVYQQTTEDRLESARETYRQAGVAAVCEPFFRDVASLLGKAHLVIARAGASTVSEIAVMGRPSILIPLKIAMEDHQTENAKALAERGAADVIAEDDFAPAPLSALLSDRLGDAADLASRAEAARSAGRPDATADLLRLALALAAAEMETE